MRSQPKNLTSLKDQRDALTRRIEKLESEREIITRIAEKAIAEADELGITKLDLALAIAPVLAVYTNAGAAKDIRARAARKTKRYTNPNTDEVIETKGGNHKVLRAWKDQYGASTVESWAEILVNK